MNPQLLQQAYDAGFNAVMTKTAGRVQPRAQASQLQQAYDAGFTAVMNKAAQMGYGTAAGIGGLAGAAFSALRRGPEGETREEKIKRIIREAAIAAGVGAAGLYGYNAWKERQQTQQANSQRDDQEQILAASNTATGADVPEPAAVAQAAAAAANAPTVGVAPSDVNSSFMANQGADDGHDLSEGRVIKPFGSPPATAAKVKATRQPKPGTQARPKQTAATTPKFRVTQPKPVGPSTQNPRAYTPQSKYTQFGAPPKEPKPFVEPEPDPPAPPPPPPRPPDYSKVDALGATMGFDMPGARAAGKTSLEIQDLTSRGRPKQRYLWFDDPGIISDYHVGDTKATSGMHDTAAPNWLPTWLGGEYGVQARSDLAPFLKPK